MKWQDFYFGWLGDIGFYQWFNATLNGNKTDVPVGSSTNIGSVPFQRNETEPTVPQYAHPAQELINTQLLTTELLAAQTNGPLRRMRTRGQMYSNNAVAYLRGSEFGEGQRNTLRYWGVQPQGIDFDSQSNLYRGYSYYINAMKQKVVLRTQRGSVIKKDKDWLADNKGRTYPTTRRPTTAQMVTIPHPDYQKWGDVGNIMQINWGAMGGYSAITYNPNRDYNTTVELSDGRATLIPTEGSELDYEVENAEDYVRQLAEYIASGDDIHFRHKHFDESHYAHDKVLHDVTTQVAAILIREKPDITVTTAEVINYILSPAFLSLLFGYESSSGSATLPFNETFTTWMENFPLSQEAIFEIIQLNSLLHHTDVGFLNFPMSPLLFTKQVMSPNTTNNQQSSQVTIAGQTFMVAHEATTPQQPASKRRCSWNNPVAGGEQVLMRNADEQLYEILNGLWDEMELCDDELLAWLNEKTRSETDWTIRQIYYKPFFQIPTWSNPNYAAEVMQQIMNGETAWIAPQQSIDWLPRDVAFVVNQAMPRYLYELPLREWMGQYYESAPNPQNLKYWIVDSKFIHFNTKRQRGRSDPTIEDFHVISLGDRTGRNDSGNVVMPGVKNNIGISEVTATPENFQGEIMIEALPQTIYSFWDRSHDWPMEMPETNGTDSQGGGGRGGRGGKSATVAPLHSMLSAMDEDSDWWNSFLDNDEGILSMTTDEDSPTGWKGWSKAWNYCYMENVIWRLRNNSQPPAWVEDLTLENFCEKIYPSKNISVSYHPKQVPYLNTTEWRELSLSAQATQIADEVSLQNENLYENPNPTTLIPHPNLYHHRIFNRGSSQKWTPTYLQGSGGATKHTKLPRLNMSYVDNIVMPVNRESNAAITRTYQAFSGVSSREPREITIEDYQVPNWNLTFYPPLPVAAINGRQIQNGDYTWARGNLTVTGLYPMILEDDAANIAILPNIARMENYGDATAWAEGREGQGYNRPGWAWNGSLIDFLYTTNDGTRPDIDFNSAKKVILSDLPNDIFQMESYSNLSSRNIDYTAPSGSPWRRGKIPMINWSAILSPKLLTMLTSEE